MYLNFEDEGFDDPLTPAGYTLSNVTDLIMRPALSYVLRLWAEDDNGRWVWRLSLMPVPGDQPRGFSSLEAAIAFLQAEMDKEETQHERHH